MEKVYICNILDQAKTRFGATISFKNEHSLNTENICDLKKKYNPDFQFNDISNL
jgi:hypothetical protein